MTTINNLASTILTSMNGSIERVAELLKESRASVFLTGAGMSKLAGLPTFRGKDGLWNTADSHDWARRETFNHNSEDWYDTFWKYYEKRQTLIPSIAHQALSGIANALRADLVTQNIDGFDLNAGVSPLRLYEIHGNDRRLCCTECDYNIATKDWLEGQTKGTLPVCPDKHILKPTILLFGNDEVPGLRAVRDNAYDRIVEADTLVAIGTSLEIPYVAEWVLEFANTKEQLVIVNPERTIGDAAAQVVVRETAELALTNLYQYMEL